MLARIETYFTDTRQKAIDKFSEDFRNCNSPLIPLTADTYPLPITNIVLIVHTPKPNTMNNLVPHLERMADNALNKKKHPAKKPSFQEFSSENCENLMENMLHQVVSSSESSKTTSLSSSTSSACTPTLWNEGVIDQNKRLIKRRVPIRHIVLHRMLCEEVTINAAVNFELLHQIYNIDNRKLLRHTQEVCDMCQNIVYNAHNLVANENCFVKTNVRSISPLRCCCIVVNGLVHCGHCLSSFEHIRNTKKAFENMMRLDMEFLNEVVE